MPLSRRFLSPNARIPISSRSEESKVSRTSPEIRCSLKFSERCPKPQVPNQSITLSVDQLSTSEVVGNPNTGGIHGAAYGGIDIASKARVSNPGGGNKGATGDGDDAGTFSLKPFNATNACSMPATLLSWTFFLRGRFSCSKWQKRQSCPF